MWSVFMVSIPLLLIYLFVNAIITLNNLDEECNRRKISLDNEFTTTQKINLLRIDSYWTIFDAILLSLLFFILLIRYQIIFNTQILSKIAPCILVITWFSVFLIGNIIFYNQLKKI